MRSFCVVLYHHKKKKNMGKRTNDSDVVFKIITVELATIEEWKKAKLKNVEFTRIYLTGDKVFQAEGTVEDEYGVVHDCTWNYQGVCRDKRSKVIIMEGCLCE